MFSFSFERHLEVSSATAWHENVTYLHKTWKVREFLCVEIRDRRPEITRIVCTGSLYLPELE